MKIFFRFLFFIIAIVFFGWLYIVYLYLHNENKQTLENIKEDLGKEVKVVAKAVKKEQAKIERVAKEVADVVSGRQSEMVDFVKSMQKEAFEIKDIADRFKDVSERTLRRDLQKLEKIGLVKQIGSTRNSRYKVLQ